MNNEEELSRLKVSLGLDSAQFTQSVTDINRRLKAVKSEFEAVSDGSKEYANSLEGLEEKNKMLSRSMQLQSAKVQELKRKYEESVRVKGADAKETQSLLTRYNKTLGVMKRTEAQLKDTTDAIEKQTDKWKKAEKGLTEFGDKAKGIGSKLSTTVTPAVLGVGIGLGKMADNADSSGKRVQRSLGLTENQAKSLNKTVKALYKEGFGESMQDVEKAVTSTKLNMKGLNGKELKESARNASWLAEIMEEDVNEVTRAGGNIMKGFGEDSEKSFDLMAWGMQNGLNFSNEMLDNLSEYAPLYKKMGFSSEEYFKLLKKGSDSGVYNLDYINDAMKEFQIRTKDNSKATIEAMGQTSKATQGVFTEFSNGKATVKDLHNAVIKDLSSMEDQTKANEIGVALYGTKWEDLEADSMYAMGNIEGKITGLDGAMDRSGKNIERSFGERLKISLRNLQDGVLPVGERLLDLADRILPKVTGALSDMVDWWDDLSPAMQDFTIALGGIAIVAPPLLLAVGGIAGAIGGLMPIISGVTGVIAGGAGLTASTGLLGAGLTALVSPVGLSVLALAGLATGAVVLSKKMDEPIAKSDKFAGNISANTKSILGDYDKLANESKLYLQGMALGNEEVTKKHVDTMVKMYQGMTDQILLQLDTRYQEEKAKMVEYFANSDALSTEEESKILTDMDENHIKQRTKIEKNNDEKIEIAKSLEGKKGEEVRKGNEKINKIETENYKIMVDATVKNKDEQLRIQKNLKDQKGIIELEEVLQSARNAKDARDKTVKQAKKKAEETIEFIKYQRDVTGEISEKQADKLIKEAEREQKDVVKASEKVYEDTVENAYEKAGENAKQANWETLETLTWADKWANKMTDASNWVKRLFGMEEDEKKSSYKESNSQKIKRQNAKFTAPTKRANGTPRGTHQGGTALVGEEGIELAHIPKQGLAMLGVGGQHLIDLPKGSSVLPHRHTKKVMQQYGIPMYADGIGDYFDVFTKGSGAVWDLLKKKFNLDEIGDNSNWGNAHGSMEHVLKQVGGGAKKWIQEQWDNFMPFGGGESFSFPSNFVMTSGFGQRWGTLHKGLDFGASAGTPIPSQSGGKVRYAGFGKRGSGYGGYGNVVHIDSGGGISYLYGHNSKNLVKTGQSVSKGDIIGLVGNTGDSQGNHLHFEIRQNNVPVNPMDFIGGLGMATGGKGVQQWSSLATKALTMEGQYSKANLQRMLMQMNSESSGNPKAINLWDSNAKRGTPSKGLMQVIDPTFKQWARKGYNSNIYDPLSNMLASIRYSKATYGSLANAWKGKGYEAGGFVDKEHLALVGEDNKKEVIIPLERYSKRAKELWTQAGVEIGMINPQNSQGVTNNSYAGATNETNHYYSIHVQYTGSTSDGDVEALANKLETIIERKNRIKSRSQGVS